MRKTYKDIYTDYQRRKKKHEGLIKSCIIYAFLVFLALAGLCLTGTLVAFGFAPAVVLFLVVFVIGLVGLARALKAIGRVKLRLREKLFFEFYNICSSLSSFLAHKRADDLRKVREDLKSVVNTASRASGLQTGFKTDARLAAMLDMMTHNISKRYLKELRAPDKQKARTYLYKFRKVLRYLKTENIDLMYKMLKRDYERVTRGRFYAVSLVLRSISFKEAQKYIVASFLAGVVEAIAVVVFAIPLLFSDVGSFLSFFMLSVTLVISIKKFIVDYVDNVVSK